MLGFRDLTSLVGEFLFRWSTMEQTLSREILKFETGGIDRVRGTLEERLDRWRQIQSARNEPGQSDEIIAQIRELRALRNLIVHGFAGGNSAPDRGVEPYIKCVIGGWEQPTGEERVIRAAELQHWIDATDACRRGLARPMAFNYRL